MIIDARNEFLDNVSVALTAGASWQNVGSQIDLSEVRDIGNGEPLYLVIAVGATGIKAGGAGSIAFRLASDDSATIHASTSTVHVQSPTFVTGTTSDVGVLAAGTMLLVVALPIEGNAYERYIGIQALVSTENTTAGTVDAYLTHDVAKWKAYPDAL